jgi:hypothetical protein
VLLLLLPFSLFHCITIGTTTTPSDQQCHLAMSSGS